MANPESFASQAAENFDYYMCHLTCVSGLMKSYLNIFRYYREDGIPKSILTKKMLVISE